VISSIFIEVSWSLNLLISLILINYIWRSISWEADSCSDNEKMPAFYKTQMCITVFARARNSGLLWERVLTGRHPHKQFSNNSFSYWPPFYAYVYKMCSSNFPTGIFHWFLISQMRATFPAKFYNIILKHFPTWQICSVTYIYNWLTTEGSSTHTSYSENSGFKSR
jgi:hypothetical protein